MKMKMKMKRMSSVAASSVLLRAAARTHRPSSDTLAVIKAVIFDIDGTLVDSVDFHAEAWQRAFAKFGKEIPFEKIRSQIGKGGDQLLPVFWSKEELERIEEPLTKYRSRALSKGVSAARAGRSRKSASSSSTCWRDGKQVALASSAKGEELGAYKKIARIDDLVDTATSSDDAEKSKPHPDIFEAALEKLGHPPAAELPRRRRHALRYRSGGQGRPAHDRGPLRRLSRGDSARRRGDLRRPGGSAGALRGVAAGRGKFQIPVTRDQISSQPQRPNA